MSGTIGNVKKSRHKIGNGSFETISIRWTGDAVTGSVPSIAILEQPEVEQISGGLVSARVAFDSGGDAPAECDLVITDSEGVDLLGGGATGDNAFTGSGKIDLSPPGLFHSALYLTIATAAGNAGKSATVVLYVLR